MIVAAPLAPVHWTTYVQTFAVIASTIGTFVYVYFTYHIMKWAVGQGKASVAVAQNALAERRSQRFSSLRRVDAILSDIPRITSHDDFRPSLVGGLLERWRQFFGVVDDLLSSGEVEIAFDAMTSKARKLYTSANDKFASFLRASATTERDAAASELQTALILLSDCWIDMRMMCFVELDKLRIESFKSHSDS